LSYLSRRGPGSVCSHTAYITASRILDERTGQLWDYTAKGREVLATFTLAPEGSPDWAYDPQKLCTRIEKHINELADKKFRGHKDSEKNKRSLDWKKEYLSKAVTAYKSTYALPIEIDNPAHLLEVSKQIAQECFVSRGLIAMGAIHNAQGNPHLHIAATVRPLVGEKFGKRIPLKKTDVKEIRKQVADVLNRFGHEKGYNYKVDERSLKDQGKKLIATKHRGPQSQHRSLTFNRNVNRNEAIRQQNIAILLKHPEEIVKSVASQKAVFTKEDLEREIIRRVGDDAVLCGLLRMRVDWIGIPLLIGRTANDNPIYEGKSFKANLQYEEQLKDTAGSYTALLLGNPETVHLGPNARGEYVYTSEKYKEFEASLESTLLNLKEGKGEQIDEVLKNQVLAQVEAQEKISYSPEQRAAIDHLLSDQSIAVLLGRAGTGKTTVLKPVVQAYQQAGYTVFGAAFQGKVADMLARDLGVDRFTLDQLKRRWHIHETLSQKIKADELRGQAFVEARSEVKKYASFRLTNKHVLIVDEVNMVGGVLWQALLKEVERSGALLRLVGDNQQIKTLFGGDVARLVEDRVGSFTLQTVVRQKKPWMRKASALLNNHQAEEGLKPYLDRGLLEFKESMHAAKYATVADYVNFYKKARASGKTHIALAFRNEDVDDLNHAIHHHLKLKGLLKDEFTFVPKIKEDNRSIEKQEILLAIGELVRFRSNDHTERFVKTLEAGDCKTKGVQNGTVGYIDFYDAKRGTMHVRLQDGRLVGFDTAAYAALDYTYATTVMQSEAQTYDRTSLYCDPLMNLNYWLIAFTRHRDSIKAFVSKEHAANFKELLKVIRRSDYKPLITDHTITEAQKPYFDLVKSYKDQIDHAPSLIAKIMYLESKGNDLSKHPLWQDYTEACLKKTETAREIVNSWTKSKIFVQQAGLRREHIEIDAGVREKLFDEVELEAIDRVALYQQISIEAQTLAKQDPRNTEFIQKRQQRNALAYEIVTYAVLNRPFMKITEKVQEGFTQYVTFSGQVFDQRPPGLKATQNYAAQYIFSYNLSPEQKEHHQHLLDFKELKGQIAGLYQQLKEAEPIQATPQVTEGLKEQLAAASNECDELAYKIVCNYESYKDLVQPEQVEENDPRKYAVLINQSELLRHATFGELREVISHYQQAQTIPDCIRQGKKVYDFICGEGEQHQFNKQLYGLARSLGIELSRIRFEQSYGRYLREGKESLYNLRELKGVYTDIHAYRKAHQQAAEAWNVIKTKSIERIEELQNAQINSLNKLSLTNLLDRQELVDLEVAARGLKEANSDVYLTINRRISSIVNGLHDRANIVVTPVDWPELKKEIKAQQHTLNTLYPHLQKGQTSSYIGIYKEAGFENDWGNLRRAKLRQAPRMVKNHSVILQFAYPSDYKRLLKEAHEQERLEAVQTYETVSPIDKPLLAKEIMDWISIEQREKLTYTRAAVQQQETSLDGLKIFSKLNTLSPEELKEVTPAAASYVHALAHFSNLWKSYREAAEATLLEDYIALQDQQATLVENLRLKNTKFNPHYLVQQLLRSTAAELKASGITKKTYSAAAIESLSLNQSIEKANEDYQWQLTFPAQAELKDQLISLSSDQNAYFEDIWGVIQEMTKEYNPLIPAALKRNEAAFELMRQDTFDVLVESGEKEHALTQVHVYACRHALSHSTLKNVLKESGDTSFVLHPVGQFLKKQLEKSRSGTSKNIAPPSENKICKALLKAEIPPGSLGIKPEIIAAIKQQLEQENEEKTQHLSQEHPKTDVKELKDSLWRERNDTQDHQRIFNNRQRPIPQQKEWYDADQITRLLTPSYIRSIYERRLHHMGVEHTKCRQSGRYLQFGKGGKFHVRLSDGVWKYHKTSEGGSIYNFVMRTENLSFKEAVRWVAEMINAPKVTSINLEERRRQEEIWQKKSEAEELQKLKESKELTQSEYNKSKPIQGTLAEHYLREHRNYQGEIPSDIRYIPQASAHTKFPAVISFARDKDGIMTGFQKILLDPLTANKPPKQEDLVIKRSGGSIKNTAVRIQEGEGVTYIAEGIETALSIKAAGLEGEILSGFGRMVFKSAPIKNQTVVLCADYDGIGAKTHEALLQNKEFLEKKSYEVYIVWPATEGEKKLDFNDILKSEGAEKIRSLLKEQLPESIRINKVHELSVELKSDLDVEQKQQGQQISPEFSPEPLSSRATTQTLSTEFLQETPHSPDLQEKAVKKSVDDWAQEIKAKALRQPLSEELLRDLHLTKHDVITKASELLSLPDQKAAVHDLEVLAKHIVQNQKLYINVWMENPKIGDKLSEFAKSKMQIETPVKEELTAGAVIAKMRFSLFQSEQLTCQQMVQDAKKELSSLANEAIKNETLMFKIRLEDKDIYNEIHSILATEAAEKQTHQKVLEAETIRHRGRTIEIE